MRLPQLLVGKRRAIFAALVANGVAQGALAVLTAALVMRIFDGIGAPSGPIALWFGVAAAAVVATAWLRRNERVNAERLGQHYVRAVRGRLYRRLLSASARPQRRQRKGKVLLRFVGDLSALRRWISLGLARLVVAGIAVSIALSALLWLHWPFAAGVAAILTLAAGWILYRAGDLRQAIATTRRRQASLAANVTEKLNAVRAVQAFGEAAHEHRVLRRQSRRLGAAAVEQAGRIGGLRGVIDATAGGCVLAVLALAYLQPPGDLSPGMLAAVLSIIGFLTPPLRELGRAHEYWLASRVARANLLSVARATQRLPARSRQSPLRIAGGEIVLRDVGVRGVLAGLNARAPGGSRIALTGANGSGKSTLLGLIGRQFDPHKGAVVIDGQDISRVQLASLRRQVAYVGVDVPLIGSTLRRCLCYGAGRVDDARLQQVLQDCELGRLVASLDGGLAGRVGEGGSNLSQGERLRVALARALLREPRILLLDEPDANLDAQAVRALNRTIAGFPGTVVLATHRTTSLVNCDLVWRLHDGGLQQRAVHDAQEAAPDVDALAHVGPGKAVSR